jgi:hypothetical protein
MTYEKLRTIIQLQSLAWTIPMLVLCFVVLWELKKPTHRACFSGKGINNQMCWILLGLSFAFAGKIVESAWWFIPWTLAYLKHPEWLKFNNLGVFFNIIFRQAFFTVSAYCHLRAFIAPEKKNAGLKTVHWVLGISLLAGQLYMIALLLIKPFN